MLRVRIEDDPIDGRALIDARPELEEYVWLHARSAELSLALLERFLPRMEPGRPLRVLELGSAPYFFTALMADHFGANVTAVNVEAASWPGAPSTTHREVVGLEVPDGAGGLRSMALDVHVFNMEKDPFPFEAGSFDVVLCMEVLEHLGYSPSHMLGEAHRALRSGGLFFLTVPNFINIKRTVNMLLNVPTEFPYSGYGIYGRHQREFAPVEVRRLLEAHNFRVEALQTANVWPTFRGSVVKGLGNAVLNAVTKLPLPWLAAKREYILCAARTEGEAVVAYPEWLYEHRHMYPAPPHGLPKVLPDEENRSRGRAATLVATLFIAAAVLFGIRQGAADWEHLATAGFHFDPLPLVGSWLVQSLGWLLVVLNWRAIFEAVGGPTVRFRAHLVAHTWSGLGNVIPGSIWLPAGRIALYRRIGVPHLPVSAAVVVEWLLVGVAGALLYVASAPFALGASKWGGAVVIAAAAGAVVILNPRVFRRLLRVAFSLRLAGGHAGQALPAAAVVRLLFLEAVVLVAAGAGFFLLMVAVAPQASVPVAMSAWALSVAVANLLAWLPATVLFKDGAMAIALLPLYGSPVVSVAVVVAWRLWMTVVLLSWALLSSLVDRFQPDRGPNFDSRPEANAPMG